MKIFVVDNHILFREGLISLFKSQAGIEVVGEENTTQAAMPQLLLTQPEILILGYSKLEAEYFDDIHNILSSFPALKIIILTMQESNEELLSVLRSGAQGYMPKNIPLSKFMASLRALDRGEVIIPRKMITGLVNEYRRLSQNVTQTPFNLDHLTPRERDILRELGTGCSNVEIANRLYITENTVKVHIHNILKKLVLSNRREAQALARSMNGRLAY